MGSGVDVWSCRLSLSNDYVCDLQRRGDLANWEGFMGLRRQKYVGVNFCSLYVSM
jgi:hypothetical protein